MQRGRPVAYHSYKLNSAERNSLTGEQELLAVVKSHEHWRCYLEGCTGQETAVMDHNPNTFLTNKPRSSVLKEISEVASLSGKI